VLVHLFGSTLKVPEKNNDESNIVQRLNGPNFSE
jgi:hypothetical protein